MDTDEGTLKTETSDKAKPGKNRILFKMFILKELAQK